MRQHYKTFGLKRALIAIVGLRRCLPSSRRRVESTSAAPVTDVGRNGKQFRSGFSGIVEEYIKVVKFSSGLNALS